MDRRTSTRHSLDEQAFPIRLRIDNPWSGTGSIRWTAAEVWLRENVGSGEWARHGNGHRMAFYFRTVEASQGFCGAFPDLALADYSDRVDHLRSVRTSAPLVARSTVTSGS